MTGIYGIHNKVTDKWYVGQSVDVTRREKQERHFLGRGSFHGCHRNNTHFTAAWKKYGADSFEWVILEECSKEDLDAREVYWIAKKDSYHNGYNQTAGGCGRRGFHLRSETKSKLSKALAGRVLPEETRAKMSEAHKGHEVTDRCREATRRRSSVAVVQVCMDGTEYTWPSATAAARSLGLCQSNITKCCRGKLPRTGGYFWRYATEGGKINENFRPPAGSAKKKR